MHQGDKTSIILMILGSNFPLYGVLMRHL